MSLQDAWVQTLGTLSFATSHGSLANEADRLPSRTEDDKELIAAEQEYRLKTATRKFAVYGIANMFIRLHECSEVRKHKEVS